MYAPMMGPLSGVRVLDLTDDFGLLAGQMLADLGAEVIQIEPPGGADARRRGPFAGGEGDPERSLHWWAYCRGKQSAVLDLGSPEAPTRLAHLLDRVDVSIESFSPEVREKLGLDRAALAASHPELVHASITPYGTEGPKADWRGTDLTLWAAGGPLLLQGDDDRPPVRIGVPQADLHAAADAVVGVLLALRARRASGLGQHVDVSIQQSSAAATQSGLLSFHAGDTSLKRMAGGSRNGSLETRFVYPALDGYVSITHVFGSGVGPLIRKLMEYIYDEGGCDAETRDKDWVGYLVKLLSGEEPWSEFERVKRVIADFTGARTREELERAAVERGLVMAPIRGIDGVVHNEHLRARGYWVEAETPLPGLRVLQPGPFARLSASPVGASRPAPRIGADNGHLARVAAEPRRPRAASARSRPPPLDGVKILDLSWVIAGPRITRTLADFGATIVRIESSRRTDTARTLRPFPNGEPGKSVLFHSLNVGKKMMSLDLRSEAGREVFLDLVGWADVVVESFSPRAMKSWGLDYEALREIKPALIMLSSSLMGQTGPRSGFGGFGNLAAAVTGFYDLTGWPDRSPAGPWGAYTDYVSPRHGAIALLAALEHRERTGEGQYIDLCQAEAAIQFLAPAILDYTVNGVVQTRSGNEDREMAPHGVYPVVGGDRWIAIAVRNDADWGRLCELMGRPDLLEDERYARSGARLNRREELDQLLADWTIEQEPFELERRLQEGGLAASVVQGPEDLSQDEQLVHRGHFCRVEDADRGEAVIEGCYFGLSETRPRTVGGYPELGCDNYEILTEILGYDDERVAELAVADAFE